MFQNHEYSREARRQYEEKSSAVRAPTQTLSCWRDKGTSKHQLLYYVLAITLWLHQQTRHAS